MSRYRDPDLSVCVDCALGVANGVETAEQSLALDNFVQRWGNAIVSIENDEPFFSMSSCDGCGSPLGGDRYLAYFIEVAT